MEFFAEEFQRKMEYLSVLLKLIENSRTRNRIFLEDFKVIFIKLIPSITPIVLNRLYEKFNEIYKVIPGDIALFLAKEILELISYEEFYINLEPSLKDEKFLNNLNKNKIPDNPQKLMKIFSKHLSENISEQLLIYSQNNPDNYRIWNIFDKNDLKNVDYFNYDVYNTLCWVNLIYGYIQDVIKEKEGKNDALYTYHEIWKKEVQKLPLMQGIRNLKKFSQMFFNWDKVELINKLQMNLNLMRLISDTLLSKYLEEI